MRFKPILALCAGLALAGPILAPFAAADAIPMPMELTAEQDLLIGVWQEESPVSSRGMGHGFQLRTLAFGNTDLVMMTFGGITYSKDYSSTAMRGAWTAKRADKHTIVASFDQGDGRGTELKFTFDGDDAFTLEDSERPYLPPSKFRRVAPTK